MSGGDLRSWWESLRHFGLLLGPKQVRELEGAHEPDELPRYRADQLRRELTRLDAEELSPPNFCHWLRREML